MAGPLYFDRVQETSTTTGTGTYTLAGALAGYRAFSVLSNGDTCYYCAENGADWEVGLGTYATSGTTLARTTILSSSNSNAAVSWSAGTKNVFLTLPAVRYASFATMSSGDEDDRPTGVEGTIYLATDTSFGYLYFGGAWTVLNVGVDKCTFGPFSDSNYLTAGNGANKGPLFANPYTLAMGLYIESLPGTNNHIILAHSDTSLGSGWYVGASASVSNKLAMAIAGVNSGSANQFSSMSTMTTGAHALSIKYNGSNLSYSWDGATVTNIATTGTMTVADSGDTFNLGRWIASTLPCDFASIAWVRGFAVAVSDADLQVLSGSPTTYIPPKITDPIAWSWQARHYLATQSPQVPTGNASPQSLTLTGTIAKTSR